ncbi:MAG: ROK family protein [Chloroflexota bacterium]
MIAEPLILGVDIGGTKVEAALVNARGGITLSSLRPAGVQATPVQVVADLMAWVDELRLRSPGVAIVALGLGIAGQVNQETGMVVRSPNLPGWSNVPIRDEMERVLRIPTFVINDVQAATWGEWKSGAGVGALDMVCLFVGTGVGGGVVSGGRMLSGASGTAGELGHTVLDYRGPPCRCGSSGCLEAHVGGWAIALRAQQAVAVDPGAGSAIVALAGGVPEAITAETVAGAAHGGDPLAQRLVAEVGEALGAGVASAVNAFNPRMVILGGGVIEGLPELVDMVKESVKRRALHFPRSSVEIVKARLGQHAGVVGAALVARERLVEEKRQG